MSADDSRPGEPFIGTADELADFDGMRTVPEQELRDEAELFALATDMARQVVGLTRAAAAVAVQSEPRLWIKFVEEGAAVTEEFGIGRITAYLRQGVVLRASAG